MAVSSLMVGREPCVRLPVSRQMPTCVLLGRMISLGALHALCTAELRVVHNALHTLDPPCPCGAASQVGAALPQPGGAAHVQQVRGAGGAAGRLGGIPLGPGRGEARGVGAHLITAFALPGAKGSIVQQARQGGKGGSHLADVPRGRARLCQVPLGPSLGTGEAFVQGAFPVWHPCLGHRASPI